MKAISLWQPYASLVAIGAKPFETRSWAPSATLIGRRIAIHAAKASNSITMRGVSPEAKEAMTEAFACSDFTSEDFNVGLPRGTVVCTVKLHSFWQVGPQRRAMNVFGRTDRVFDGDAPDLFGDYSPGRWIWALTDIRRLAVPVPFKGRQGFFDVPDELLGVWQ